MSSSNASKDPEELKEEGNGAGTLRYVPPQLREPLLTEQGQIGSPNPRLQSINQGSSRPNPPKANKGSGSGVYRHPYSRGTGKSIPASRLQEYIPPSPLDADKSEEWNKGDTIPKGGPLPFDNSNPGQTIKAVRQFGAGSLADPMDKVLFSNNEVSKMETNHPDELQAHVTFAKNVARDLGFTYFWIRKQSHVVESKRNGTTGTRTGGVKSSQSHITVLLGIAIDWANVHGHIFLISSNNNFQYMPQEQMARDPLTGAPRRAVELWKWDEKGRVKMQNRNRELFAKKQW